jgi:aspartyl-tRNA(Asn)/glutamyl-tRNA(Gln) amidotransferase subunit A
VVTNPEYLEVTPEVRAAWSAALEGLAAAGAVLVDAQLPDWAVSFRTAADIQGPEAVANHAGRSTEHYQPDVRLRLREAAQVSPAEHDAARTRATAITSEMADLLASVDAVLTPTVLTTAPLITAADSGDAGLAVRAQLLRNTRLANLTRHPAVSLPIQADGLPVGLQVIASDNDKAAAVAGWIEGQR